MRPHIIILLPYRTRLRPQLIASSCMIHGREKYGRYTTSFRLSHTVHRRYKLTYTPGTHSSRQDSATSLVYSIDEVERFVTVGGGIYQPIDYTPTLAIYFPHLGTNLLFSLGSLWLMHIASAYTTHPLFTTSVSRNASKAFLRYIRPLIAIQLT